MNAPQHYAILAGSDRQNDDRAGPDRRQRALYLLREGRDEQSRELLLQELRTAAGEQWLRDRIVAAMEQRHLSHAGELAALLAEQQFGAAPEHANSATAMRAPQRLLSLPKLRHDLAQLKWLRARGHTEANLDVLMRQYAEAIERHAQLGKNRRTPLLPTDGAELGQSYGRILQLAEAPRLDHALSGDWDRQTAQSSYLDRRPAVAVVDNFLSEPALASLRHFCLESTIWNRNRYANGRLGAFFFAGFNCPLLLQIAEERRDALPRVIDERHPLRQLWAFKNTCELPADSTIHADFAAVNVNFWLTPTEANTDPSSGGLLIYDIDAPASWDFATYNEQLDTIRAYLVANQPRVTRVPYRQNRAIIFNSDLFHATETVRFSPGYDNHRINVTLLYGDRARDLYHPRVAPAAVGAGSRSAAFARWRR